MDVVNQPSPVITSPPPQKPNPLLAILSIIFFILLVVTSVVLFTLKSKLNTTKKSLIPTPTIVKAVSLKEEYSNPFAPTGTTEKQYSNPFEQTSNPFDE
ncbi:MAG: hypothetical protein AAB705_02700, partial [Patescibacteria group bacterium]